MPRINLELANLKRIYTLAMQAGKVLQRPHIPMLDEAQRADRILRARAVRRRARDGSAATRAKRSTLAYYTGWRVPSEILPLEWHQMDRQACVIRLEPEPRKNRDGRMFTYAELTEVREAIDVLWARHQALEQAGIIPPLVFVGGGGQPVKTLQEAI